MEANEGLNSDQTRNLLKIYEPIGAELERMDIVLFGLISDALDPFPQDIRTFRSYGKRSRPAILLLAAKLESAAAGRAALPEGTVEQAAAVELMHIATLIHDDVVDGAIFRRGHKTLHRLFTDKTAVLVGDFLYASAIDIFNRYGSRHIVDTVTKTTVGMAHGELIQTVWPPESRADLETYRKIISKKTADFFAAAAAVGAEHAGANPERRDRYREFGWNFGMAFQIVDDLLDIVADPADIGKPVFQDLVDRKITLPILQLIDADSDARRMVDGVLESGRLTDEIRVGLLEKVTALDIAGSTLREAEKYVAQGREILQKLTEQIDDHPARQSLLALSDFILTRDGLSRIPSLA